MCGLEGPPEPDACPEEPTAPTTAEAALFERCRARLLHRIELMLGPKSRRVGTSEDFLQATWIRILQTQRVPTDELHCLRLATRVARNLIVDQARRHHAQRFDSLGSAIVHGFGAASSVASPLRRVLRDENRELVLEAIESLGEAHRIVIELRDFEEQSFAEIGSQMQSSENAAQLLHARAMIKLGAALRRLLP